MKKLKKIATGLLFVLAASAIVGTLAFFEIGFPPPEPPVTDPLMQYLSRPLEIQQIEGNFVTVGKVEEIKSYRIGKVAVKSEDGQVSTAALVIPYRSLKPGSRVKLGDLMFNETRGSDLQLRGMSRAVASVVINEHE